MDLIVNTTAKNNIIKFNFSFDNKKREVYFRGDSICTQNLGESVICAFLPFAMQKGTNLLLKDSVSQELLNKTNKIQDIYDCCSPSLNRVDIHARKRKPRKRGNKIASFFSCGVDSFDTLLRNISKIDYLVYVEGFDVWPYEKEYLKLMRSKIRQAARHYKKEAIFIKTNLHLEMDADIDWAKYYHGAAIAAVSYLLPKEIGKVYIPSTFTYSSLFPWGSHPMLDELWSDGSLEIIHDGAAITRAQKIINVYTANDDFPNSLIRVCLGERSQNNYNCSTCVKCIRTITALALYRDEIDMKSFVKPARFEAILGYYDILPVNGSSVMRMGETINYYRNNMHLVDSQKLLMFEDKFREITAHGIPDSFYHMGVPYLPLDLIHENKNTETGAGRSKLILSTAKKKLGNYIGRMSKVFTKIK